MRSDSRSSRSPARTISRMSYYEKWLTALTELSVKVGLISAAELKSGRPEPGSPKQTPALSAEQVAGVFTRNTSMSAAGTGTGALRPGDTVRARNINPTSHTRLPRYGTRQDRHHRARPARTSFPTPTLGIWGRIRTASLLRCASTARELWGEEASSRDVVYLDLWDSYLEPA